MLVSKFQLNIYEVILNQSVKALPTLFDMITKRCYFLGAEVLRHTGQHAAKADDAVEGCSKLMG